VDENSEKMFLFVGMVVALIVTANFSGIKKQVGKVLARPINRTSQKAELKLKIWSSFILITLTKGHQSPWKPFSNKTKYTLLLSRNF
jgi:hypothetical protein